MTRQNITLNQQHNGSMMQSLTVEKWWFIGMLRGVIDLSLAGKSRSAAIVAAYLMKRFNIGVEEAISRIQEVRDVDPINEFRE
jgi:Dual specificity phosphatase, catalytic domain